MVYQTHSNTHIGVVGCIAAAAAAVILCGSTVQ